MSLEEFIEKQQRHIRLLSGEPLKEENMNITYAAQITEEVTP